MDANFGLETNFLYHPYNCNGQRHLVSGKLNKSPKLETLGGVILICTICGVYINHDNYDKSPQC